MTIIEDLLKYSHDPDTLRDVVRQGHDLIEVREHNDLRWIYMGGESVQSAMRLDAPAELVLPNHTAMLAALLYVEEPRHLLNLGFGVGSFERFFRDRLPQMQIVSVDTSKTLLELARKYFSIPADWPVVLQAAETYLRTEQAQYDIILCDIFAGAADQPDCLLDTDFFSNLSRCLSIDGVLAINLAPASQQALVQVLLVLRRHFDWVTIAKIPGHGNLVLLVSKQAPPDSDNLMQRAESCSKRLRVNLHDVPEHLEHLPSPAELAQKGSN